MGSTLLSGFNTSDNFSARQEAKNWFCTSGAGDYDGFMSTNKTYIAREVKP